MLFWDSYPSISDTLFLLSFYVQSLWSGFTSRCLQRFPLCNLITSPGSQGPLAYLNLHLWWELGPCVHSLVWVRVPVCISLVRFIVQVGQLKKNTPFASTLSTRINAHHCSTNVVYFSPEEITWTMIRWYICLYTTCNEQNYEIWNKTRKDTHLEQPLKNRHGREAYLQTGDSTILSHVSEYAPARFGLDRCQPST
jgi:hypothetical protein